MLPPDTTIRPFDPKDQQAARQLILAGLGDRFGRVDAARNPDLDDIMAHYVNAGHVFVVAEEAHELVGTGAMEVSEGVGHLMRMSVAAGHRRKGICTAMVMHLVDQAKRKGLGKVLIVTNNDWADAVALYKRCGFVEDGRNDVDIFLSMPIIPP
jgi:ribosomal protein S18 acetylase RimI-like enzyme